MAWADALRPCPVTCCATRRCSKCCGAVFIAFSARAAYARACLLACSSSLSYNGVPSPLHGQRARRYATGLSRSQVCHVPPPRSPRRETASGSLPPGRARGRPRGSRLGGVDGEGPARECRAVKACNSGLRGLAVRHGHGAIALGTATQRVDHDVDDPHSPIRREELSEGRRRHTGRQITHRNVHARVLWCDHDPQQCPPAAWATALAPDKTGPWRLRQGVGGTRHPHGRTIIALCAVEQTLSCQSSAQPSANQTRGARALLVSAPPHRTCPLRAAVCGRWPRSPVPRSAAACGGRAVCVDHGCVALACLERQHGPLIVRPSLSMQETWRRSLPSAPAQGTAAITPMARCDPVLPWRPKVPSEAVSVRLYGKICAMRAMEGSDIQVMLAGNGDFATH